MARTVGHGDICGEEQQSLLLKLIRSRHLLTDRWASLSAVHHRTFTLEPLR